MRTEFFNKVEADLQPKLDAGVERLDQIKPWDDHVTTDEALDDFFLNIFGHPLGEPKRPDMSVGARNPEIEAFLKAVAVNIHESANMAAYTGGMDAVTIPSITRFRDPQMYYRILFHELAHWTGHPSRTSRMEIAPNGHMSFKGQGFGELRGKDAYAEEELVAEYCAAYLSAHFGLPNGDRHASYLNHWRSQAPAAAMERAKVKAREAFVYLVGKAGLDETANGTYVQGEGKEESVSCTC